MIFKSLKGKKQPSNKIAVKAGQGETPPGFDTQPDGMIENAVALATGLEMVDAYYPGHDPIDYYGDGGFRFGDMSHQGALMFLPSGIRRWDVETADRVNANSFTKLFEEKDDIEILLIGTGKQLALLDPEVKTAIREQGIKLDIMDTGAAVRTLNILLSEDRAVAAALLPVD